MFLFDFLFISLVLIDYMEASMIISLENENTFQMVIERLKSDVSLRSWLD